VHGSDARVKWQAAGAGTRYTGARWSSQRRRRRDPHLVAALLDRHLPANAHALLLDAPCGTGRLSDVLRARGRYVGLDVSRAMLSEAQKTSAGTAWLAGDVARLPFRDSCFDAVVCCRLLHHLEDARALEAVLGELVRVSRALVIASFWDASSLPAWRRRLFPGRRSARRHALQRTWLAAALSRAGAEVVGWKHSFRFVSRQAFVVARKSVAP
jgi:ubiquinone/menaquinone biosynthesis C-methylase UbiE